MALLVLDVKNVRFQVSDLKLHHVFVRMRGTVWYIDLYSILVPHVSLSTVSTSLNINCSFIEAVDTSSQRSLPPADSLHQETSEEVAEAKGQLQQQMDSRLSH